MQDHHYARRIGIMRQRAAALRIKPLSHGKNKWFQSFADYQLRAQIALKLHPAAINQSIKPHKFEVCSDPRYAVNSQICLRRHRAFERNLIGAHLIGGHIVTEHTMRRSRQMRHGIAMRFKNIVVHQGLPRAFFWWRQMVIA